MNPLGMVVALLDAMNHAAVLEPSNQAKVSKFTACVREAMYKAFREGKGTRDMAGPSGVTTEGFVAAVRENLDVLMAAPGMPEPYVEAAETKPSRKFSPDEERMKALFDKYDINGDDSISFEEFSEMMLDLGLAPKSEASSINKDSELVA